MAATILEALCLLFVGVLAGEEFIVRWGVQPALRSLPDDAHIRARVALVRRLRVVVPSIMLPASAVSVATLIVAGTGAGFGWHLASTLALVAFLGFSFGGTVPINIRVIEWDAANPPADWLRVVARWERLDVLRSSAAMLAFALAIIGAVVAR